MTQRMQPQEVEVSIEELNRCSEAIKGLFGPMVEQFRGDWTSTEGQREEPEIFEEFLKRQATHVKKSQSVAIFAIGKLSQQVSCDELREFVEAYFSIPVEFLTDQEVNLIPKNNAWRSIPGYVSQANAISILDHVLKPQKEPNAARCWGIIAIIGENHRFAVTRTIPN